MAVDVYQISNTQFFTILSNYNNPIYNDSILIDQITKPILLRLCDSTYYNSVNTRTKQIMADIKSDINLYDGKTLLYIKNN